MAMDQYRAWVRVQPTGTDTVVVDAYTEEEARQYCESLHGVGCIIFMARRKPEFAEAERKREREARQ